MYGSRAIRSFAEGYNFVDQAFANKERRERQKKLDERSDILFDRQSEAYEDNKDWQKTQREHTKKQWQRQDKLNEREDTLFEQRMKDRESDKAWQEESRRQQRSQWRAKEDEVEYAKKQREKQELSRSLAAIDYKIKSGVPFDEEDKKVLDKAIPGWKEAYNPEQVAASKNVMIGLRNLKSFREINKSPELLSSLNVLYKKQVVKGVGEEVTLPDVKAPDGTVLKKGKKVKIIDKNIAQIVPGRQKGTVAIGLNVTYIDEDGNIGNYSAPLTEGRDAKGNNVKQIKFDDFLQDLTARASYTLMLNQGRTRKSLRAKQIGLSGLQDRKGNPVKEYMDAFKIANSANQNAQLYGALSGNDEQPDLVDPDAILRQAQQYAAQQQDY